MAAEEHIQIIRQGVNVWNECRQKNPELIPDLHGADLIQANLSGANLDRAKLDKAKLKGAKFRGTLLLGADLRGADLSGQNSSGRSSAGRASATWTSEGRADLSGAQLTLPTAKAGGFSLLHLSPAMAGLTAAPRAFKVSVCPTATNRIPSALRFRAALRSRS